MNDLILQFAKKYLGIAIRYGIMVIGARLAAKGLPSVDEGTAANLTDIAVGAILMGGTFVWSIIRTRVLHDHIEVAKETGLNPTIPADKAALKQQEDPKP